MRRTRTPGRRGAQCDHGDRVRVDRIGLAAVDGGEHPRPDIQRRQVRVHRRSGGVPLHSHDYVFNDDTLAAGVAYYREVVTGSLVEG